MCPMPAEFSLGVHISHCLNLRCELTLSPLAYESDLLLISLLSELAYQPHLPGVVNVKYRKRCLAH